jgi:hypothetical protein
VSFTLLIQAQFSQFSFASRFKRRYYWLVRISRTVTGCAPDPRSAHIRIPSRCARFGPGALHKFTRVLLSQSHVFLAVPGLETGVYPLRAQRDRSSKLENAAGTFSACNLIMGKTCLQLQLIQCTNHPANDLNSTFFFE